MDRPGPRGRRRLVAATGAVVVLLGLGVIGTAVVLSIPEEQPEPTPYVPAPELEPDLSRLSAEDRSLAAHHLGGLGDAASLGEGSWIYAGPMTVDEAVSRLLGPSPRRATRDDDRLIDDARASSYGFLQVGDGVVGHEPTGFAPPPRRLLAALSAGGAVAAVVTENIEAMTYFGYARDGRTIFGPTEYIFVDEVARYPAEIRELASLAWVDLDGDLTEETADGTVIGHVLSEKVTGVRADARVQEVRERYLVPLPW